MGEPLRSGEGEVIAKMDSRGHYSHPELLSLLIDAHRPAHVHQLREEQVPVDIEDIDHVSA